MKRIFKIVPLILLCLVFTGCKAEENKADFTLPENYKLAYSEEFEGEIDESVWRKSPFTPRKGGYWSPEQVKTENGNLVITTEEKGGEKPGYYTGKLEWHTKRSTYGYYEIRCKVENVRGLWSAFWLMPDTMGEKDGKASDGCEIDVFESALPGRIQNTLHYDAYADNRKKSAKVESLYNGYHTFAVDWKKDSLKFYCDGKLTWEVTDPDLMAHMPTAVKISTEIGGFTKDGTAKPSRFFWLGNGSINDSKEALPSRFTVDYVKIYDNGQLVWSEKE